MFAPEVYKNRRNALRSKVSDGIILITGNTDTPMNYPANIFHFRQDSNFLYFFGLDHPGFAGIIDENGESIVFGNDVDIEDIIWMGPQPSVSDLAAKVAVSKTYLFAELGKYLSDKVKQGVTVHFLPQYRSENKVMLSEMLGIPMIGLKEVASIELIKGVVALRSIKEPCEIEEIRKACKIGWEMHTTAMRMAQPGIYEREIAGAIEGIALSHGGMLSFPAIVSQNGETLHNHCHANQLKEGRMLLVDAGAETSTHYASDNTRTFPSTRKFTQKQKEIYQIVLNANLKSTEATLPGVLYRDIHKIACLEVTQGLKDLGLMKGDVQEAVEAGAHAMFFPHGLGHMMGLDVHDMEDLGENYVGYDEEIKRSDQFGLAYLRLGRRLQPGFVLTNEPGIYFIPALIEKWKAEKINDAFINFERVAEYIDFGGIRIEDDILITQSGHEVFGPAIPKEINDIENFS
ncbi:MAG: aminopeptidase P family protein [Bacteroidetes bacterium]|nr:aminopeptidase P family protein [Bacteroidota bacterium]